LISEPIRETFRQTAGYDEFAPGPLPTIGAWPIKPSEQKGQGKAFSHAKTKSVGLQECRQLVHTDSIARPTTAPGIQPTPVSLSDPARFEQHSRVSQGEMRMRSKSLHAPPQVPEVPTGLAGRGGPKYFDLLQAAVSASRTKAPSDSIRTSFDVYNESVADRNSRYGKPPKLAANKHAPNNSLTHADIPPLPAHTSDAQRASFDAMRASRNARMLVSRAVSQRRSADLPRPPTAGVDDAAMETVPEDLKWQDRAVVDANTVGQILPAHEPGDSGRLKQNSVTKTDLPPQLSPIAPEQNSSAVSAAESSSVLIGSKPVPGRKRSKTTPVAGTLNNVSDGGQAESPAVLTLEPFEDGSKRILAAENPPVPWGSNTNGETHNSPASGDHIPDNKRASFASDDVPPRISSDRIARRREKKKRRSQGVAMVPKKTPSEKASSVKGSSLKMSNSSKTAMSSTANDHGKGSDEEDENDYDLGIEEAVTHKADPVQILRASVVSANGYIYRGGDKILLGKVLHHTPSQSLSQSDNHRFSASATDTVSGTKSEGGDNTFSPVKAPSPPPNATADPPVRSSPNRIDPEVVTARSTQSSPNPGAAGDSLQVPPSAPAEARASLSNSVYTQHPDLRERPLQSQSEIVERAGSAPPALRTAANEDILTTVAPAAPPYQAVSQHKPYVPLSNENAEIVPPAPEIVTRDFAHPQVPPRVYPLEAFEGSQSAPTNGIGRQIDRKARTNASRGYIHISMQDLESQSSDLDRTIAIKKEAAAKALLKLQEVMAMPTWEEPSSVGRPRASTRVPNHWRGLSIEDGSPIAPNAIFTKVKMPVLPPLSRHSTFSSTGGQARREGPEKPTDGNGHGVLPSSLQAALEHASLSDVRKRDNISSAVALASTELPALERRGRSDTAVPAVKRAHSRMSSTVSAKSGTSAYSVPYHMVPARSSSRRDSESYASDFGDSSRFHVGELGWH
jgi:hypothetical protein